MRTTAATGLLSRIRAYDFSPEWSDRVRRGLRTPLGVLLGAFAVAMLAGIGVHPRVFALAGGIALLVGLGVCWPWLTLRGVRSQLRFDRVRTCEGESIRVSLAVGNHLPWPAWGLAVRDGFRPESGEIEVRLAAVGSRSRVVSEWSFTPTCRGEYPLVAPRLVCGFPFGLRESRTTIGIEGRLLVWPATLPVGPVPQSESDDTTEGSVTRNRVGSTGDVVGVRPYRRGDSPRRIHWAQSARHDRLIVCELQSSSRPVVVILLDADPATHTPGADGSREWAIRVAASFVRGWLREGAMVGLVTSTGVVPPASGESQLTRVMDHLARLPSGSSKQHDAADLRTLLRHPGFAVPGAVRVVVVSDAGFSRAARNPSLRWVVLDRRGFAGEDSHAPSANCEEAPERHRPTPWLDIDSKHKLEFLLRQGWSEARHGS